jgi:hypothetical protein
MRWPVPVVVVMAVLGGCPMSAPTEPDAGADVDEEVAYEGETVTGAIPILDEGEAPFEPLDAGPFTIDRRCCQLAFTIRDEEGPGATGIVAGSFGALAADGGVPLRRTNGVWTGGACFPLGSAASYVYVFTTRRDGGAADGDSGIGDGGVEVVRFSDLEPNQPDGLGGTINFIPSVSDCGALDASVGMLP